MARRFADEGVALRLGARIERARLGLLPGEQLVEHLHDRHLAAEPPERLTELAADRPAADDRQPAWLFAQVPDGLVGQRTGVGETGDGRDHRARPGRDERAAVLERAPTRVDPSRAREARLSLHHLDAVGTQRVGRVHRLDGRDRRPDTIHDLREAELGLVRLEPERVRGAHPVREAGGRDEALARHAARPEAVAAQAVALEEHHAGTEPGGRPRRHQPRGAATDHCKVVDHDPSFTWHMRART